VAEPFQDADRRLYHRYRAANDAHWPGATALSQRRDGPVRTDNKTLYYDSNDGDNEPMSKTTNTPQRYSLDELAALVDVPKRTIRYYVQIGLVDRPVGETRAAYYTHTHAEQLIAVRKWSASGLSLERIRDLLRGADAPAPARPRGPGTVEVWSHLVIADGVELTLEPTRAGLSPHQVRALLQEVGAVFERIRKEDE